MKPGTMTAIASHRERVRKQSISHLKRCRADDGVFVAAVSAVLDVVAQVVDVDALAVVAVPLELVAALGSFPAPVEKE